MQVLSIFDTESLFPMVVKFYMWIKKIHIANRFKVLIWYLPTIFFFICPKNSLRNLKKNFLLFAQFRECWTVVADSYYLPMLMGLPSLKIWVNCKLSWRKLFVVPTTYSLYHCLYKYIHWDWSSDESEEEKLALVCGSRAHLEEEAIATRSFFRTVLMKGFHLLVWLFAARSIRDTQCGFKLLTRPTARLCFPSLHIERWQVKLLLQATQI